MKWTIVEENWTQYKGTMKAGWDALIARRLHAASGKPVPLAGKVEKVGELAEDKDKR